MPSLKAAGGGGRVAMRVRVVVIVKVMIQVRGMRRRRRSTRRRRRRSRRSRGRRRTVTMIPTHEAPLELLPCELPGCQLGRHSSGLGFSDGGGGLYNHHSIELPVGTSFLDDQADSSNLERHEPQPEHGGAFFFFPLFGAVSAPSAEGSPALGSAL